jgi:hypothetical protein
MNADKDEYYYNNEDNEYNDEEYEDYIDDKENEDYGKEDHEDRKPPAKFTMNVDKMADEVAFCINIKDPQTALKSKEEACTKANRLIN